MSIYKQKVGENTNRKQIICICLRIFIEVLKGYNMKRSFEK